MPSQRIERFVQKPVLTEYVTVGTGSDSTIRVKMVGNFQDTPEQLARVHEADNRVQNRYYDYARQQAQLEAAQKTANNGLSSRHTHTSAPETTKK